MLGIKYYILPEIFGIIANRKESVRVRITEISINRSLLLFWAFSIYTYISFNFIAGAWFPIVALLVRSSILSIFHLINFQIL